jgi:hypothetical protein
MYDNITQHNACRISKAVTQGDNQSTVEASDAAAAMIDQLVNYARSSASRETTTGSADRDLGRIAAAGAKGSH